MSPKGHKSIKELISRKRKGSPFKNNNFNTKKYNKNGIVQIIYKLNGTLFESNKYIKIFGQDFVKNNTNKCKMIIGNKEYEIKHEINLEEFEKYGINREDKIMKVILKGEAVEDMSCMFFGCDSLIKADFSSFITQNITNMKNILYGCKNLIEVNLSSFNTQKVTNMGSMFWGCESLTALDLSSFNTENVTDMVCMFNGCKHLTKVDLTSFETKNVTNMGGMFCCCISLIKVNLSSFETKNVTNMGGMFYFCKNLIKADLSSFDIQNVSNANAMFWGYENLIKIERKNFQKIKNNLKLRKSKLSIIEV